MTGEMFMNINFCKLRTPDFALGKIIVLGKTIADCLKLLLRRPDKESVRFARLMLAVKPQFTTVSKEFNDSFQPCEAYKQPGFTG
jgi:hypothetical protein